MNCGIILCGHFPLERRNTGTSLCYFGRWLCFRFRIDKNRHLLCMYRQTKIFRSNTTFVLVRKKPEFETR